MKTAEKVKQILEEHFKPSKLEIVDLSHQHSGHAGSNGLSHLKIDIQSEAFSSITMIQRHKLIYGVLDSLINTEIHALSINARG